MKRNVALTLGKWGRICLIFLLVLSMAAFAACKKDPVETLPPDTDPVDPPVTDPVDPVETDRALDPSTPVGSLSYLDKNGTVNLYNIAIPTDDFAVLAPYSASLLDESHLLVITWNLEKDLPVDQALVVYDLATRKTTGWSLDIGDFPVPNNIVRNGDRVLLWGQANQYTFGWILAGNPAAPTVTKIDSYDEVRAFTAQSHVTVSPDGKYTVYIDTQDENVCLKTADGATKVLFPLHRISDNIQYAARYLPFAFVNETTFVYNVGNNAGFGYYDVLSGEETLYEDGRTVLSVGDGTVYTATSDGQAFREFFKETVGGTPEKLLDKTTQVEALKPLFTSGLTGQFFGSDYVAYSYEEAGYDRGVCLRINVYDADFSERAFAVRFFTDRFSTKAWVLYGDQVLLFTGTPS